MVPETKLLAKYTSACEICIHGVPAKL